LVLLLVTLIFFGSCKNHTNDSIELQGNISVSPQPSYEPQIIIDKTDNVFELSHVSFFFDDTAVLNGYDYTNDRLQWYDVVQYTFGIDLKIHELSSNEELMDIYSSVMAGEGYTALKRMINEGTVTGLFKLYGADAIYRLAEDGLIIDLGPYLKDNTNWSSLPSDFKNAYTIGDRVYGIASRVEDVVYSRYIRGDWLDNLGILKPSTIDEFYEVMKAFTYEDPDLDEVNNTSGAIFFGQKGLEDIFTSFDARLNHEGMFFPCWNPNTNIWEDSMLKSEMVDCVNFITMCREEEIIERREYNDGKNQFETGYTGSFYSSMNRYETAAIAINESRPETINARVDIITGLIHKIDDNINGYYTNYRHPYVMTGNCEHPYSTLNTLVNVFMADRYGYLLGAWGIEGIGYEKVDDTIIINSIIENDTQYTYRTPLIMFTSPFYNYSYTNKAAYESRRWSISNELDRNNKVETDLLSYLIPNNVVNADIPANIVSGMKDLNNNMTNMMNNVFEGSLAFDDFLAEYRKVARAMGFQEFLDDQNIKLGKTSGQEY